MSNRPPDDDFGFDDDDFSFDDDEGTTGANNEEGFSFDDEEFDFGGDEEFDFGGDDDITFEEEEERRGPSRTFIAIAAAMIILFLVALGVLVLFVFNNQGPTDLELTATSIVATNNRIAQFGQETATAAVFFAQTQTAQANLTATELARPTNTPTPSPTASPTATVPPDLTEAAAFAMQTQAAFNLTATADALNASANATLTAQASGPTSPPTVAINAVAQTATALALILQPTVGGQVATPTIEGGQPPTLPTALPDTGLFDDLAAGGAGSLGGLLLAVIGLIGVIAISRRLRAANR
jgi:cytoskeletal protein RodZ